MDSRLLVAFHNRVQEIDSYWQYLIAAARLAEAGAVRKETSISQLIGQMSASLAPGLRKTFDYSSVTVALYGAIEDYVERLIEHCVDVIGDAVDSYQSLPHPMRKHHERLSIKLAEQVGQPGYRGHLNLRTVIDNLHECLTHRPSFRLNREAFSLHSANMRHDVVREMFAAISIPNIDREVASHDLTQRLLADLGRSQRDAHFYLDDLADRRNMVAHGERPYDVISMNMMGEYLRAARVFGQTLYECAVLGVCEIAIPSAAHSMGQPTATYQSGKVICLRPSVSAEIRVGDRVLWRSQTRWNMARIDTLQVDRQDLVHFSCQPNSKFGLGISRNGSERAHYWLLRGW